MFAIVFLRLTVHSFRGHADSFLHVGPGQVFVGSLPDHGEFNINVHIYEQGLFILPPTFTCYGITLVVR